MARILVFFGTTDGHTAKVAGSIAEALTAAGATPDLVDAAHGDPSPADYDGVIVAASLHAGGYQSAVRRWVRAHAGEFAGRPSTFVSVCLGVLQHDPKVDVELLRLREQFFEETGWRPDDVKTVAGALLYTRYNWLTRVAMVRIVRKAGGDTDTSRDYEYTDWNDLRAFAAAFAGDVIRRHAAVPVPVTAT